MMDFPKKREKTSHLLRNTQQVSFHVYRSFGIIHVKCYVKFIWYLVNICEVVDLFLLKLFWFFLRKDELISDVLLWTPAYGQAKAGRPARTYIQQLCEDTGCSYEDLPEAMNDREKWRERVRDIRASGTT